MISVGIDVAKGKSTVCMLKPYGEIVCKPFDIEHQNKDLSELTSMILKFYLGFLRMMKRMMKMCI